MPDGSTGRQLSCGKRRKVNPQWITAQGKRTTCTRHNVLDHVEVIMRSHRCCSLWHYTCCRMSPENLKNDHCSYAKMQRGVSLSSCPYRQDTKPPAPREPRPRNPCRTSCSDTQIWASQTSARHFKYTKYKNNQGTCREFLHISYSTMRLLDSRISLSIQVI